MAAALRVVIWQVRAALLPAPAQRPRYAHRLTSWVKYSVNKDGTYSVDFSLADMMAYRGAKMNKPVRALTSSPTARKTGSSAMRIQTPVTSVSL
jgi:hypothetical protein